MSALDCRRIRRPLAAYHDGELAMRRAGCGAGPSRVAARPVPANGCALIGVGALLRAGVSDRAARGSADRIDRHVLAPLQAEPQLVVAPAACNGSSRICTWSGPAGRVGGNVWSLWRRSLGLMALTLREQPLSMAAMIGAMAAPGSNRNPVSRSTGACCCRGRAWQAWSIRR